MWGMGSSHAQPSDADTDTHTTAASLSVLHASSMPVSLSLVGAVKPMTKARLRAPGMGIYRDTTLATTGVLPEQRAAVAGGRIVSTSHGNQSASDRATIISRGIRGGSLVSLKSSHPLSAAQGGVARVVEVRDTLYRLESVTEAVMRERKE